MTTSARVTIGEHEYSAAVPHHLIRDFHALPEPQRDAWLLELSVDERRALVYLLQFDHDLWLHPHQREPPGDWRWWVMLAGRGAGKTHTGATTTIRRAREARVHWLTLIAPTREAFRKLMLFGPAGIMTLSPPWFKPVWESSKLTLTWPNGVIARCYSAEKPERLRGEQHEFVWVEELGAWTQPEAFDHVDIGLRMGPNPQGIVTTTPKMRPLILDLVMGPKVDKVRVPRPDVVVTRAKMEDNPELSRVYAAGMRTKYGSSRFGRQELDAELLERTGEELFTEELIAKFRAQNVPRLRRVAVAVDPTRSNDPVDEAGIIVGALGDDGHGYVMDDLTVRETPAGWAVAAVGAYHKYKADVLVYEKNRLGKRGEDTIRVIDPKVHWKAVVASDGKDIRAEPVSALFEQGKIHLVGHFRMLEDELTTWRPGEAWSPNRLDAFVWLITELMLEDQLPDLAAV